MDTVKKYRSIVKQLINEIGSRKDKPNKSIRYQVITDDNTGNYLLIRNGWRGTTRFYTNIIHVEVTSDGKVWLHQDNTDLIIADELIEAGVSAQDIILAFNAPMMREELALL
jgi:ligand-binding sensor domain-containing protein